MTGKIKSLKDGKDKWKESLTLQIIWWNVSTMTVRSLSLALQEDSMNLIREAPPSNSIFEGNDASCPSIKSIYDDLDLLETMYSGADIELESTYKRRRGRKF